MIGIFQGVQIFYGAKFEIPGTWNNEGAEKIKVKLLKVSIFKIIMF